MMKDIQPLYISTLPMIVAGEVVREVVIEGIMIVVEEDTSLVGVVSLVVATGAQITLLKSNIRSTESKNET